MIRPCTFLASGYCSQSLAFVEASLPSLSLLSHEVLLCVSPNSPLFKRTAVILGLAPLSPPSLQPIQYSLFICFLLKSLLGLLPHCFYFTFWLFGHKAVWDLSSLTRNGTHTPCIGRQSLDPWTPREVPKSLLNMIISAKILFPNNVMFISSRLTWTFGGHYSTQYMRGPALFWSSGTVSLRKWCLRSHLQDEQELMIRGMKSGPIWSSSASGSGYSKEALKKGKTQLSGEPWTYSRLLIGETKN